VAALARFALRKSVRLIALLVAVSVVSFLLLEISPVDPVLAYIGADERLIGPEQRELIARRWGLDQPPLTRYALWIEQALQGNLGTSRIYNAPVTQVIGERFAASLALMAAAWILSGVLGFALGVLAGATRDSIVDRGIRLYAYTLASTPTFWIGLLLLLVFAVELQVAPVCCAGPPGVLPDQISLGQRIHHLLLPALTLSVIGVANIALHTRAKLIGVLESDFAVFARAQGESRSGVVVQHGLRNIVFPALTLQFASLSELFGGSVLAETVFTYPGLGHATVEAGLRSDVPLLMGIVLFSAVFVFVGNTLADVVYGFIDPRVRLGAQA
jgi:peptide/nickel transport system permease protein